VRHQEILEACWKGYRQAGMKKKGDRMVPNCVPVKEVKTGPEMTLNDLLYTAAAKAMHQAGLEGVPMDYEEAIKKAAKIYRIPYTPSELPRLLAQRAEIDRKLAMLKQGKQIAKARRQEKLAPTPAGAEEYWKSHALPTDRIKPPAKTLEETEAELAEDLRKWFKEKWVRFGPDGKIRGDCARGSSSEGKPKCLPQSKAHALGKKGRASAAAKKRREDPNPERRGPAKNVATKVKEETNPKFAALIKNIQARLKKDDYQRPEIMKRVAQMVQQADPATQDAMATAQQLVQQYGSGPVVKQTNVWDLKAQARSGNLAAQLPKTSAGTPSYAQQHATFEEQYTDDDDWYDDEDQETELRSGDYVRDQMDGEHGEIFRMQGDPYERRVRILDRDGKGWYIEPSRLTRVDPADPDIQRYFGKKRHRDMDEATGDQKFDTMMGRIVDPVAALSQDRVYEEQLEDYVFEFMNEFLGRMDRLGIEVWLDDARAGEDLTNPKFLRAYEQASVKAVQRFMQGKKLDVNNQRLVAKVKADFDENADQVNPVAGFLGAFMQGFTVLRPGEIDVLNKAGMLKKPGDVNEQETTDRTGKPMYQAKEKFLVRHNGKDVAFFPDMEQAKLAAKDLMQDLKGFATVHRVMREGNIQPESKTMWRVIYRGQVKGVYDTMQRAAEIAQRLQEKYGVQARVEQTVTPVKELDEKQDACYRKVKSRYKVWPSAYASGALVQCRKKGAANWGNKTKKE
jgi:hypothetical protein